MPVATIEILDEVNVKIHGLDQKTKGMAQNVLSYYVPGAHYIPQVKAKKWDGKTRLFGASGKTHLNLLQEILGLIERQGYTFEVKDNRKPSPVFGSNITIDENAMSNYTWDGSTPVILRDYQVEAINTAFREKGGLLRLATGAGKAQPVDTLMPTPDGERRMGDLQVGDHVYGSDGKPTIVTGVYPQGKKDVYTFKFRDGRTTQACAEHLWNVTIDGEKWEILDTLAILRIMTGEDITRYSTVFVPFCGAVEMEERDTATDPYLVGKMMADAPQGWVIPDSIKNNSIRVRSQFIKGFLSSDTVADSLKGKLIIASDKTFLSDIQRIIWSLGGECIIHPVRDGFIAIMNVYSDAHKHNEIISIEKTDSQQECVCISVSNPDHQYLTTNYIVTHNTIVCATMSKLLSVYGNVLMIVPNVDLVEQSKATFDKIGIDCGVWYGKKKVRKPITISTWQSLQKAPELFDGVVAVILDEAHQCKANTIFDILTGPGANVPFRIGCTGSLPKDDLSKAHLLAAVGNIIYSLDAKTLQDEEVLAASRIKIINMQDKYNPEYLSKCQDFKLWNEETNFFFEDEKRLNAMVKIISDSVEQYGNTLVLVPYHASGEALIPHFTRAVSLDGRVSSAKRKVAYDHFNSTDGNVLIATYGIASVGIDIPRIFSLVIIEPGKKFEKIIQTLGRGLRKAHDKDYLMVFDIVSSNGLSKTHSRRRISIYKEARQEVVSEEWDYCSQPQKNLVR